MAQSQSPVATVRDERIDTLRGLFLVIMTIDHIGPPWITRFSSEPIGFVSAMEGFFLLSGYTYALVYRRFLPTPALLWERTLRRVRTLYAHHLLGLGLVFVVSALGVFHAGAWLERARDLHALGVPNLALWGALLVYRPQFFDVLPTYVLLMLAAPWWLQALSSPPGARRLLFLSALAWALAQAWDPVTQLAAATSPVGSVWPNILGWQAVFVLGMWMAAGAAPWALRTPVTVLCAGLACLFLFMRHELLAVEPALHVFLGKHNVGALRMLNLLVMVQLAVVAMSGIPKSASIRGLAFLGRHSLEVFSFHVLLAYVATAITVETKVEGLLLVLACVALLALPAWAHERLTRPR